jgi:hypothetical protein
MAAAAAADFAVASDAGARAVHVNPWSVLTSTPQPDDAGSIAGFRAPHAAALSSEDHLARARGVASRQNGSTHSPPPRARHNMLITSGG